jgi:hypothetical protein
MDSTSSLEGRVVALETSLRRTRLLAVVLGLSVLMILVPAFVPQAQDVVTTRRLVLTDATDSAAVVLLAGPEASVIIQTPSGDEVLRLGGAAARRVGH